MQAPQTAPLGEGSAQRGHASLMRARAAQHGGQTSRLPHGAVQNAQLCGSDRWQIRAIASHADSQGLWWLSNFSFAKFDNEEGLIDTPRKENARSQFPFLAPPTLSAESMTTR